MPVNLIDFLTQPAPIAVFALVLIVFLAGYCSLKAYDK